MEWLGVLLLYLISGFMKKRQQNKNREIIESDPTWDNEEFFEREDTSNDIEQLLNDLFEQNPKVPKPNSAVKEILVSENDEQLVEAPEIQSEQLVGEEIIDEDEDKSAELYETIDLLMTQNKKLESIVYQLNEKLEETLLSNAKLLYQNRTLNDASLNERQKSKIVEAISNAESPKEAKSLHETLRATVGSDQKKRPQSLNETVNRRSNLSSMLNTRQNLNESKSADPFMEKMQKLAGIKK